MKFKPEDLQFLTPEEQQEVEKSSEALVRYDEAMCGYRETLERKEKILRGYSELISETDDWVKRVVLEADREVFSAKYPLRKPERLIWEEGRLKYFIGIVQQRKVAERRREEYERKIAEALQRWELQRRQEEEARRREELWRRMQETDKKMQLRVRANAAIEEFRKKSLTRKRQKPEDVFASYGDARYLGFSLESMLPWEERKKRDADIENWVGNEVVPGGEMGRFLRYECNHSYFLLPRAEYSYDKVPCLNFSFNVFAVIEIAFWKTVGRVQTDAYSYIGDLRQPEFIGYLYRITTLGGFYWGSIPLTLFQSLTGNTPLPADIKLTYAGDKSITYGIKGLDDKDRITISHEFRDYLLRVKKKGGLVPLGILAPQVGAILEHLEEMPTGTPKKPGVDGEVVEALVTLGWKKSDVKQAVAAMTFPENATPEEKVKLAFQNLGGGVDKDKT